MGSQPARWVVAYWTIVVTGVFTVTLHGFGETNPVWGAHWFWAVTISSSNTAARVRGDKTGQYRSKEWHVSYS
jgi:hypothetical protein